MAKKEQVEGKRSYWREADARRALVAWERTGLSLAAYARQAGIPVTRLRRWQGRLSTQAAPAFTEVRVVPTAPAGPTGASERGAGTATSVIAGEVIVGPYVVRAPLGFDDGELRRLVRAVRAC